jgi:hypothetical protein
MLVLCKLAAMARGMIFQCVGLILCGETLACVKACAVIEFSLMAFPANLMLHAQSLGKLGL